MALGRLLLAAAACYSLLLAATPATAGASGGGSSGKSHRPPIMGRPGSFLSHTGGAAPSGAGRGIGGSGIVISGRGGAATVAPPTAPSTAGAPASAAPPPAAPMAGMPLATGPDYRRHYPAHAVTPLAALKHFSVSEEKGLTSEEALARCVFEAFGGGCSFSSRLSVPHCMLKSPPIPNPHTQQQLGSPPWAPTSWRPRSRRRCWS